MDDDVKEALEVYHLLKMGLTLKNILGYDELDSDLRYKLQFIEGEMTKETQRGMNNG